MGLARYRRELGVAAVYAALLALLRIYAPGFFHEQFRGLWVTAAPVLVAAVGMTLVIVAREIDISIGSLFSVCGIVAAVAAKSWPMPMAAAAAVGAGMIVGAFNGVLVAFIGMPSIVVTLASMVILDQSLRWARQGAEVSGLPAGFQWLGFSQRGGEWLVIAAALGVLVIFAAGTRWLAAGRAVYAVGCDRESARLAGLRPRRVVFGVFVLMGALAAVAALLNAIRFPQADPNAGRGLELQVIAAVVVGGTAITGGRGTMLGTLIGVALLVSIAPALTFLHLQAQWERAIQGLIILLAVASDGLRRGR